MGQRLDARGELAQPRLVGVVEPSDVTLHRVVEPAELLRAGSGGGEVERAVMERVMVVVAVAARHLRAEQLPLRLRLLVAQPVARRLEAGA